MTHTITPGAIPRSAASRSKWQLRAIINEEVLAKYADVIFFGLFVLFIVTALLLFDIKLFLMGDDADYIIDAQNFITHHIYPSGRSSLYAVVMGGFIAMGGISVVQLKLFSLCCAIMAFYLAYVSFKGRVPYRVLFITLLLVAINAEVQYYSSSNLSEAFFMMMQMLFFNAAFLLHDQLKVGERKLWPYWCYVGIAVLLLTLSKNIAAAALLCLPLFFLLLKNIRMALWSLAVLLVVKLLSELLIHAIFDSNTVVSQMGQVFSKDLYHPEYGRETFVGFVSRFFTNVPVYLSKDLFTILGFRSVTAATPPVFLWVLPVSLLVFAMWKAYKNNHYLFLTGVYLCLMMGASFLALQPAVAQMRIIIIYVPLLLCMMLYGGYNMAPRVSRVVVPLFCFSLLTASLYRSIQKVTDNVPVLAENLEGNPYYGYTPDWINYLQMGKYVAAEIPPDEIVAARKPNSLSIFAGERPFYGIYTVSTEATADELLATLRAGKIRYLILASLRQYPGRASANIVNTLHRYTSIIEAKYPGKVHLVKSIGTTEPCHLVKIDY